MCKQPNLDQIAIAHHSPFNDRPTLVFLHDSLGCIALWRDFPEKLGKLTQCNVLVYDRLGYGLSGNFTSNTRDNRYLEEQADVLVELLDHYQIESPILFGHSDGASIAIIAAGKYPNRIKAYIAEGAHVFVEEVTLEGIRTALQAYTTTSLREKLMRYHGEKTDAVFQAWTTTWLNPAFGSWNIEHFLPTTTCPSLIIQGSLDEYGSLAQVESLCNNSNGKAESYIIPNVHHSPHKEATDLVLARCHAFIAKIC